MEHCRGLDDLQAEILDRRLTVAQVRRPSVGSAIRAALRPTVVPICNSTHE